MEKKRKLLLILVLLSNLQFSNKIEKNKKLQKYKSFTDLLVPGFFNLTTLTSIFCYGKMEN